MQPSATALIAQLDSVLDLVRAYWLAAADRTVERSKWLGRLNELLDQRLALMRLRDSGADV